MPLSPLEPEPSSTPASALRLFLSVFPSIILPMFLAIVDQTIVAAALPAIAGELGQPERVSWIVVAYLVAATILAPVYGRVGDIVGRKLLMVGALAIFISASLFCAFSTSMLMLTCGRILQGIGGGGLMTLSHALVADSVPARERARYHGFLAVVGVTSSTFGPVTGGFLTEHFGWRSIFLVNIPIGLLAILLTFRLPRPERSAQNFHFDTIGLLLFATFVVSTLLMLGELQRLNASIVWLIAMLAAFSIGALVLLIRYELRVRHPLLPLSLLRQATIWRTNAMAACYLAAQISLLTFLPIYFRVVHGETPAAIGLLLLPMTAGIGFGSVTTGWLIGTTGRTAVFPSTALMVGCALLTVFAFWSPYAGAVQASVLLGCAAVFMGTVMSVAQVTVQTAGGSAMIGTASASLQIARTLGASLGTGLVGAALFTSLSLTDTNAAFYFGEILQHGPGALADLPIAEQSLLQREIARAFRYAFLLDAAFIALCCALAWSIPLRRL